MKTFKRIAAIFLAVLLVASIGLVAVSAAGHELEIKLAKAESEGFSYTVYKIADLVKDGGKIKDGSYTCLNDDIKAIVDSNAANTSGADFRNALDALYKSKPSAFGSALANKVSYGSSVKVSAEGIYYAVLASKDDMPATYTKANNVVIVWPEFKLPSSDATQKDWVYDTTVALDGKVASGTDSFDKYFTQMNSDGKITVDKAPKFKGVGQVVEYTLEGTITGSAAEHLKKFEFTDTMSAGLDYVENSMKVYYGKDDVVDTSVDLLAGGKFTETHTGKTNFTISAQSSILNDNSFYNTAAHNKIFVQYQAKVNNKAVIGNAGNPNTGKLTYTNAANLSKEFDPQTVYVYTFKVTGLKKKGDVDEPLAGAKFQIGTGSADGNLTGVFAYGTSDADGNIVFTANDAAFNETSNPAYRFAPGSYKCKETSVPDGYALSSVIYDVVVPESLTNPSTQSNDKFEIKVNNGQAILNYPVKLPETGGAGTMMFTIIGGCLVLAAGVMFVIIMKKRSSSK